MHYSSEDLATYHAALKLPTHVIPEFNALVEKWVQHSGIEWTVNRLKTIYTDFVRYHANMPLVGQWYKKNSSGLPSGILSYIFTYGSSSRKNLFRCATLLRVYTRYISSKSTDQQIDKFIRGVNAEDITIPSDIVTGVLKGSDLCFGKIGVKPNQPSYLSYSPSPGKRVPEIDGTTSPEDLSWSNQWETIVSTETGKTLTRKYPSIFGPLFSGFKYIKSVTNGPFTSSFINMPMISEFNSVGKIGMIQEPGFKLRAVANPNRAYQVALDPLKQSIMKLLKDTPWDCTHDQSKAVPIIQKHLQAKGRCHCIDLSGATDYFPLSLQIDMLKNLFVGLGDYIDLFYDLSRSSWFFRDTTISWSKGQPLGLGPSFGSFSMTHGLLIYYLNDYQFNGKFFVLGDDVIILDDSLALKYYQALKKLECPISESKCMTSTSCAEFAGKIIFDDVVLPQLKWRQLSDDNFVDIVRLLGPSSLRLLRPKQRKVVKAIWDISEFDGGIGFNPHGIPYKDRYVKYLSLFGDKTNEYLMSYDRHFNEFFNSSHNMTDNKVLSQQWDETKLPDLDQRSVALVLKYLPNLLQMWNILGTNLYTVVPNKDVLPISGCEAKRQTLLGQLQRKLGL